MGNSTNLSKSDGRTHTPKRNKRRTQQSRSASISISCRARARSGSSADIDGRGSSLLSSFLWLVVDRLLVGRSSFFLWTRFDKNEKKGTGVRPSKWFSKVPKKKEMPYLNSVPKPGKTIEPRPHYQTTNRTRLLIDGQSGSLRLSHRNSVTKPSKTQYWYSYHSSLKNPSTEPDQSGSPRLPHQNSVTKPSNKTQ